MFFQNSVVVSILDSIFALSEAICPSVAENENIKIFIKINLSQEKMGEPNDFAIGIDLGTTNTVFAVYRRNNVEVLQNSEGDRLTKSCVMYCWRRARR